VTANPKTIRHINGNVLRCNGCKATFRWMPGRVGDSRAAARAEGWTTASRRKEHASSRMIASNVVKDWCATCTAAQENA
jgi:hypothetical protein